MFLCEDDLKYFLHIQECISRIEEDSAGGHASFDVSHTMRDAVLHNLQLIAESTKRLSDTRNVAHPEINWSGIVGFRNFLVHDYVTVDLELVWRIVKRDVPEPKRTMNAMLAA